MKFALIFFAVFALSVNVESQLFHDHTVPDHTAFESFQEHFKRDYHPREKSKRFAMFKETRKHVHTMNEKYKLGLITFKSKLNHLSDMSREEFSNFVLGGNKRGDFKMPTDLVYADELEGHRRHKRAAPANYDWRSKNAVSGAQDQGNCGSGYSFAAISTIETSAYILCSVLYKFSEEEPVECSGPQGNSNCSSGTAPFVYRYYINKAAGVISLPNYPYTSLASGTVNPCSASTRQPSITLVTDFKNFAPTEAVLLSAVFNQGSTANYVNVNYDSFQSYSSGIWADPACTNSTDMVDHYMACVGYGTNSAGVAFWVFKNSWSSGWGISGFIRWQRNNNNMCCAACFASIPVVSGC
jgi:C1A family cysteine protease